MSANQDPFAGDPFGNDTVNEEWSADLDSVREHLSEYRRIKAEIARLEKLATAERELIEKVMGEAPAGKLDGQTALTYKYEPRESFDGKRLRQERPDVWREYASVKSVRYFRIK